MKFVNRQLRDMTMNELRREIEAHEDGRRDGQELADHHAAKLRQLERERDRRMPPPAARYPNTGETPR